MVEVVCISPVGEGISSSDAAEWGVMQTGYEAKCRWFSSWRIHAMLETGAGLESEVLVKGLESEDC